MTISENSGDKIGIANAMANIGILERAIGNTEKTEKCFARYLSLSEEMDNKTMIAKAMGSMAIVYFEQGNHFQALEYFRKQLILHEESGDLMGISIVVGNLGAFYSRLGKLNKAVMYIEKALTISREMGDKKGVISNLRNLGCSYRDLGDFDKSLNYFEEELNLCVLNEDVNDKISAILNFGTIKTALGKYKDALEHYETALVLSRKHDITEKILFALSGKAECLYLMGEYIRAKESNNKCRLLAIEKEYHDHLFALNVLHEKIEFKISCDLDTKYTNIQNLKKLLTRVDTEGGSQKEIAEVNFEIALMLNELNEDPSIYREKSINLFKDLFESSPMIKYQNKYEKLENLLF